MVLGVLLSLAGRTLADNLSVETVNMGAGETKEVAIVLENPEKTYAAFQFEVVLPEGISVAKDGDGKPMVSLDDERIDDHTLTVKDVGSNTYRLLSFSMSNAAFAGTGGALVRMTLKADKNASVGARTVTITGQTFTEASAKQVEWSDVSFTVNILGPVTIKADDQTRAYGEDNPAWSYTVTSGEVYGDGVPTMSCEATPKSPVGTYDITIEKGTVENPATLTKGTLTVTKAPLTITAKSYTIKQGDALPVFDATYSGFRNNETSAVLTTQPTITTTATSASAPGTYDITVSGATAQNYNISYVKGTLTIEPNAVKITANSYTIKYGDKIPVFDYASEGSTPIGTPSITCAATSASPIGQYPIRISRGSVSNGEATFVDGMLTITKAPLTITAKSYSIKQGEPLPATYEINFSGFKNGETKSVLSQQPSVTCAATAASEPGRYDIIVSGAAAKNYEISYVKGTLRIRDLSSIKGDINDDGEVDVTDVVELIDMVLGGIYDAVGDINGDGEVDVTDVVELIDMVLAGE